VAEDKRGSAGGEARITRVSGKLFYLFLCFCLYTVCLLFARWFFHRLAHVTYSNVIITFKKNDKFNPNSNGKLNG
jgi:hypothetical protein